MRRIFSILALILVFHNGFSQRLGFGIDLAAQERATVFNGYHVEEGTISSYGFNSLVSFGEGTLSPYVFLSLDNGFRFNLKITPSSNSTFLSGVGPGQLFKKKNFLSNSSQGLTAFSFMSTQIRNWKISLDANYTIFQINKFKTNVMLGLGFTKTASNFSKEPVNNYLLINYVGDPNYASGSIVQISQDMENANRSFFENTYFPLFGYFHWQAGLNFRFQNIKLEFEYGNSFAILNDANSTFKSFYWGQISLGFDILSSPVNFKKPKPEEFSINNENRKNFFAFEVGSIQYFNAEFKQAQTFESTPSNLDGSPYSPALDTAFLSVHDNSNFIPNFPSVGLSFNHQFKGNFWSSSLLKWQNIRYSYAAARIVMLDSYFDEPRLRIYSESHEAHLISLDQSLNYTFLRLKKWSLFSGARLSAMTILNRNTSGLVQPLKYDVLNFSYGLNLGVKYRDISLNFNLSRTVLDAIRAPNFSALGKINNFNFSFSIPIK
ncbi:MAG: hypothetical protein ACI857_002932 [Arenicella sp.]|jgi:hypothetical protein